jgi:hypothetical protein
MQLRARATSETPLFDKKGKFVGLLGPGPFRWFHVVRTRQGLALNARAEGDDLTPSEVAEAKAAFNKAKYEVIEHT